MKVSGLLDTGASCTCIDPSVIQQLGIPPSGVTSIVTPSTGIIPVVCDQFDVSLALLLDKGRLHVIDTPPVIQSNLSRYGHHVLFWPRCLVAGTAVFQWESRDGYGGVLRSSRQRQVARSKRTSPLLAISLHTGDNRKCWRRTSPLEPA
ncbi:MAG: aspartyl protease family protein [Pirellulaceae bacterium]